MSEVDLVKFSENNTSFAIDLYHQLRNEDGNIFFSPYSISVALAMTYAGARGETESQIARVLHFDMPQENLHAAFSALQEKLVEAESAGGVQLKIANSLWPHVDYPFLKTYLDLVLKYYGVGITALDYINDTEGARQKINNWVEQKTERKIRELIGKGILNDLTRLVLTNAIYFKGNWSAQFDARATKEENFWPPHGPVEVPMMTRKGNYRYKETKDLQILELPYVGDRLSMLVLLPREKDGLPNLESRLTSDFLAEAKNKFWEHEVIVHLPKFKVETGFNLNEALISLGISEAFDMDKANFAGMDGKENWLYIDLVIHKAFVEINEEGTEAAAATAVVMQSLGSSKPVEFRADHPFLFLIRERETGSILFIGRYSNP
jgi:serpin B